MGKKYGQTPAHQQNVLEALRQVGFNPSPRGERISLEHAGNTKAYAEIARRLQRELPEQLAQEHADAVHAFLAPHVPDTHHMHVELKKTGTGKHEKPVEVRVEFREK